MKLTLSCKVHSTDIDQDKLEAKIQKVLRREFLAALKVWYTYIWEHMPVYTGMSQSSLIPLGEVLNKTKGDTVPTAVTGIQFPPGAWMTPSGEKVLSKKDRAYFPSGKNPEAGVESGERCYDLQDKGRLQTLVWTIPTPQWSNNEEGNPLATTSGNWFLLVGAEDAFRRYIDTRRGQIKTSMKRAVKEALQVRVTATGKGRR